MTAPTPPRYLGFRPRSAAVYEAAFEPGAPVFHPDALGALGWTVHRGVPPVWSGPGAHYIPAEDPHHLMVLALVYNGEVLRNGVDRLAYIAPPKDFLGRMVDLAYLLSWPDLLADRVAPFGSIFDLTYLATEAP